MSVLSDKSIELLKSFPSPLLRSVHLSKTTKDTLKPLYNDLHNAHKYIQNMEPISYEITKYNSLMPRDYEDDYFPKVIKDLIHTQSKHQLKMQFTLFERNITVYFILNSFQQSEIHMYLSYTKRMILWLHILTKYSRKTCAETLTIFLYFTTHEKKLPASSKTLLSTPHVNTAYTTTCSKHSEIVIYRKEEWFKVFLHETMHSFGLDFSHLNITAGSRKILSLFNITSDVYLYEAYTEFWAETINIFIWSFFFNKKRNDYDEFISYVELMFKYEISFSGFQISKILNFMGGDFKYTDLLTEKAMMHYKEDTSVLSYYIIKAILMTNCQSFIQWCKINNGEANIISFEESKLDSFCTFIEENYNNRQMLQYMEIGEKHTLNQNEHYITNTLRMSIYDLS